MGKLFASSAAACLFIAGTLAIGSSAAHAATETVTDTPATVPIEVDASSILRDFNVTAEGEVVKVTIGVDVLFHPGSVCSAPVGGGTRWPAELRMALVAPSGAQAALVYSFGAPTGPTYSDSPSIDGRYVVVFDDDAAELVGTTNSRLPTSGTFRPEEPLSVFQGETAAGVWQLLFEDTIGSDPKCYFGATLNVETSAMNQDLDPDDQSPQQAPTRPTLISTAVK